MFHISSCIREGSSLSVQVSSDTSYYLGLVPSWSLCQAALSIKPLSLAWGSLGQFDTIFPQGLLRSQPKHPLLDHKPQIQSTLDRNPQKTPTDQADFNHKSSTDCPLILFPLAAASRVACAAPTCSSSLLLKLCCHHFSLIGCEGY